MLSGPATGQRVGHPNAPYSELAVNEALAAERGLEVADYLANVWLPEPNDTFRNRVDTDSAGNQEPCHPRAPHLGLADLGSIGVGNQHRCHPRDVPRTSTRGPSGLHRLRLRNGGVIVESGRIRIFEEESAS